MGLCTSLSIGVFLIQGHLIHQKKIEIRYDVEQLYICYGKKSVHRTA